MSRIPVGMETEDKELLLNYEADFKYCCPETFVKEFQAIMKEARKEGYTLIHINEEETLLHSRGFCRACNGLDQFNPYKVTLQFTSPISKFF